MYLSSKNGNANCEVTYHRVHFINSLTINAFTMLLNRVISLISLLTIPACTMNRLLQQAFTMLIICSLGLTAKKLNLQWKFTSLSHRACKQDPSSHFNNSTVIRADKCFSVYHLPFEHRWCLLPTFKKHVNQTRSAKIKYCLFGIASLLLWNTPQLIKF